MQLATTRDKLEQAGIETLAIVNTQPERARLYFKFRPTRVLLAADPDAESHQAFGLPQFEIVTEEQEGASSGWPHRATGEQLLALRINPTGEMAEPTHPLDANEVLNRADGFEPNEVDQQIVAAHGTQLAGHFLVDRDGLIRWVRAEAIARPEDIAKFPDAEEILAAARAL